MKCIVGLGNPGKQYENTKHNLGFMVIDQLKKEHGLDQTKGQFEALVTEWQLHGEKILLVKPETFMNASGRSVRKVFDFYKLEPKDILVVYDDIDLEIGSIRLRKSGGPGTHNGMRDIVNCLSSKDFPRLRVGAGRNGQKDLAEYVLSGFSKEQWKLIDEAIERSVSAIEVWILEGIESAMNRYNGSI
ncbi:aminoacyl-tRNA hydrolase [Guggenheimella bovis]